MHDTTKEMQQKWEAMIMQRTPTERLRMACQMLDTAKELIKAGLEDRYGPLTTAQIRAQTFIALYRHDFTPEQLQNIIHALPEMDPNVPIG